MEKDILKLTSEAYRILDYLPESDPLKNKAKEKVLIIIEQVIAVSERSLRSHSEKQKIREQALQDISVLLSFFEIGKNRNWISPANCLIASNEYQKIKKRLEAVKEPNQEKEQDKIVAKQTSLTDRQGKIIDFLSKNDKAQVASLQSVLPNVTKRTIRRDLDELLEAGRILRFGEFNEVFYRRVK